MKRDPDPIQSLLREVEEHDGYLFVIAQHVQMTKAETIRFHHACLCVDVGLLDQVSTDVFRLSNAGHDFLDTTRDAERWELVKANAKEAGGVTVDLLKLLAKAYPKKKLEDATGLEI